jgi:predicted transposase YdaD
MPSTPHDSLFKSTFSQVEHVAGELRASLPPALASRLDFTTLELCPGSFVDEAFAWRHTDLLFTVLFAGRPAVVYVLFEHQSTVDARMPFRLLRYMIRIWEAHLAKHPDTTKLPVIIPLVLHHGEGGWRAAVAFEDLLDIDADLLSEIGAHVPRFRFVLDDLAATTDEAIRARAMSALGRLVLWCLKHARQQGVFKRDLAGWADVLRDVWHAPDGGAAVRMIFRYVFEADETLTVDELRALVANRVDKDVEEEVVTLADRLREEGRLNGERMGRAEGELRQQRKIVIKLLTLRFGPLSDATVDRINAAGMDQLEIWSERVLTAATLAEMLGAS